MFSFKLATNPWMFYELSVPAPEWYEVSKIPWRGKSVKYHRLSCCYVGWFKAVVYTDEIRNFYEETFRLCMICRTVLGMGAHPRLGAGSQLRTLDENVLGMIARLL
jgi:hypothetical protein